MLRRRLVSLVQIALVFVICALAYTYAPEQAPRPASSDLATRLAFAAAWLVVPGATFLTSLMLVALGRFFGTSEAFDGARTSASRFMEINLRVAQNTLEQVVLASIAWLGLAVTLPAERLGLIPVLAALFAAGRILFWAGYQIHPLARALGFGMTVVPTAVALFWLVARVLAG